MARTYALRVDQTGLRPMFTCLQSLAEALAVAQFEGEIDIEISTDSLAYAGEVIAGVRFDPPMFTGTELVCKPRAWPTFRMPLFAAEMCRLAPGVKVCWCDGGWPRFHANDGSGEAERDPDPVTPEKMPCPTG